MDLDKAIKSRRSTRKFKLRKPDWRDIIDCVDSMRYTPLAGNNSSLKILIVNDEKKIQKLSKSCQQNFISGAKYLVVIYSNPTRMTTLFGKKGEEYSKQQMGAAIQNFLLKIEEKGLSTCWIGHFVESQIKGELKIPDKMNVEAIFPIGYEMKKEKPQHRINLDRMLYFNSHGNKKMRQPKKLSA